jgi:MFS family permease
MHIAEIVFITGLTALGIISLGAGFVNDKIALIILRALGGICAAETIPSALSLLVVVFPDPHEQARAIGVFGGCGAVANGQYLVPSSTIVADPSLRAVGGLFIGALFVQFTSWRWVFWFAAIIALPVAGLVAILAPALALTPGRTYGRMKKVRRLDIPGVAVITIGLLLFIFSVTEGGAIGWATPTVLAPLALAVVLLIPGFFIYERLVPERYAAMLVHRLCNDDLPAHGRAQPTSHVVLPEFFRSLWGGALPAIVWNAHGFRVRCSDGVAAGGLRFLPFTPHSGSKSMAGPR